MDANFWLRSKLRGASSQDPTSGPGWSYFVNYPPYSRFIKNYIDEEEVCRNSTCLKILLTTLDMDLCGLSSTAEHADEEIKGVKGNRTHSCQLHMTPAISSTRSWGSTERRMVSVINNWPNIWILITNPFNVIWTIYSVLVSSMLVFSISQYLTMWDVSGSPSSGSAWCISPLLLPS